MLLPDFYISFHIIFREEKDAMKNLISSNAAIVHLVKANLAIGIMAIPIGFKYSGLLVGVFGILQNVLEMKNLPEFL